MTDYELQQQLAEQRRQRYASQSQFQAPQGQMIGRHFVAPNALQYLASGLRSLGGMRGEQLAEQELGQIKQQKAEGTQKALADFLRQSQGTPEQQAPFQAPAFDEQDAAMMQQQGMRNVTPAVAPNMQGAYAALMQAPDAGLRNMGMQGMIQMPELEAKRADRVAEREFKQQQLQDQFAQRMELLREQNASRQEMAQAQRDFQREMAAQGFAARREIAQIAAANRPEKMVTVIDTTTGNPVMVPQSQATGMTPFTPQTAGSTKKQIEQTQAKEQLDGAVSQLRSYYDDLKTGGGIVNQQSGGLANIGARIGASGLGQTLGGAVGTKNQEARQKIEQTRPLLLNLIKNATGMSAQQMNSNAEMQLYLRAATDPTLSYEANNEALNNLTKLFGTGQVVNPSASSNSVNVNGQTYNRPANMTDAQWNAYKQQAGAK